MRAGVAAVLRGPAALRREPSPRRGTLDGDRAGRAACSVDHDGNSTSSPEEAAAIVADTRRLLGATWTDEDGTRRLAQADVLVVAPYNAQVLLLQDHFDAAGLPDVAVGTVDKFQGRQAPVVFVSMTASSIDDVPRGISFLLNRNRLNVAVSRAKYLQHHRAIGGADRVPAGHAGRPDRAGRVLSSPRSAARVPDAAKPGAASRLRP